MTQVYKKPFFQKVLKALPKKYYTLYTIKAVKIPSFHIVCGEN